MISFGFIIAIILIKYKPMYEVKISGEKIGYIKDIKELDCIIEEDIKNYSAKNINSVEISENPEYKLKLVEKKQIDNEEEIIIALQRKVKITYKYYEISLDNEVIEKVDSQQEAEQILAELKNEKLSVKEILTENIEEVKTQEVEIAKSNILAKTDKKKEIANINGIKIAVLPVTGTISSRYGVSSSIRASNHTGLDIAATKGTPIKVVADGVITFAEYNGSYGNLVKVEHGNGLETWYAHTSKINVKVGQNVNAGDVIALVGNTGNSTGPHLHLEVRINGKHVNPQKYLYK